MQSRKETAWKKSRKFGDIKGGRMRTKLADNVFHRCHSLERPSDDEELPIYMQDNTSKSFYHPIDVADIEKQLKLMPTENVDKLTHIWLRKVKKADYDAGKGFQACFIKGSGINLIVLNAFPIDLKMRFGKNKPEPKNTNQYVRWTDKLESDEKGWYLVWTEETIKDYFLNYLLSYIIGHFVESKYEQYYSKADRVKRDNFASSFARVWYYKHFYK